MLIHLRLKSFYRTRLICSTLQKLFLARSYKTEIVLLKVVPQNVTNVKKTFGVDNLKSPACRQEKMACCSTGRLYQFCQTNKNLNSNATLEPYWTLNSEAYLESKILAFQPKSPNLVSKHICIEFHRSGSGVSDVDEIISRFCRS